MCNESGISGIRDKWELVRPFGKLPLGRVEVRIRRRLRKPIRRVPGTAPLNDDLRTEGRRVVSPRDQTGPGRARRTHIRRVLQRALVHIILRLQLLNSSTLLFFEGAVEGALLFHPLTCRLFGTSAFRGCRGSVAILVFLDRGRLTCCTLNTILLVKTTPTVNGILWYFTTTNDYPICHAMQRLNTRKLRLQLLNLLLGSRASLPGSGCGGGVVRACTNFTTTTGERRGQRLRAPEPGSVAAGGSFRGITGPGVLHSADFDIVRTKTIVPRRIRTITFYRRDAGTDRCRRSRTLPQRVVTTAVRVLRELLVLPIVVPEVEGIQVREGIVALLVRRDVVAASVRHMNFISRCAVHALSCMNSTCSERGGPSPLRSGIWITLLPLPTDRPVVVRAVLAARMFFRSMLHRTESRFEVQLLFIEHEFWNCVCTNA